MKNIARNSNYNDRIAIKRIEKNDGNDEREDRTCIGSLTYRMEN